MIKAAVINDISGLGRCSLTAAIPLLSAMQIQPCPLPTAVLSAQTAYDNYFLKDLSVDTCKILNAWQEQKIVFDGIYTGFFTSSEQIDEVLEYINRLNKKPLLLVDPVMGDGGELYSSMPADIISGMKRLTAAADVITPNLTEACMLSGEEYGEVSKLRGDKLLRKIESICKNLNSAGTKTAIITGIEHNRKINNAFCSGGALKLYGCKKSGSYYSGTGDAFASLVFGYSLKGFGAEKAVKKATAFIGRCVKFAASVKAEPKNGICFEKFIKKI